jgi:HK97 gp10 family phage protein
MAGLMGFNKLLETRAAIRAATSKAIHKAAFDIQARAASNAPVATGFLKSSIYVELHSRSTYAEGVAAAPPGASLLPELPRAEDDLTAYVAVGANYGIFVEFGTINAAAQPYLIPAADAVRPSLQAALDKLEETLVGLGLAI